MPTSPSLSDEVAFISNVNADGTLPLDCFYAWNPDTIPADYSGGYTLSEKWGSSTAGTPGGTVSYYFDPASNWSAVEQQQLAAGLALWSAVANISFTQTSSLSAAQIIFERGSDGTAETSTEQTSEPGAGKTGGSILLQLTSATVSIDTSVSGFGPIDGTFSQRGGYPVLTFLHEEGHAIGLGHAGPYNDTVNEATQQFSAYDSLAWSIMSYIDPSTTDAEYYNQYPIDADWGTSGRYDRVPTTWMPLDILAAQRLYGLPVSTPLSGGQVFGFNCNITGSIEPFFDFTKNTVPVVTLWDMGQDNTLDLSGFTAAETVNLNPGTYSSVDGLTDNIAIAFDTEIDTLVCSSGDNAVTCNDDGDTIFAGSGNDTIAGGSGDDTVVFSGDRSAYTVTHNAGGNVTITGSGGTDTLTNIEQLQFVDARIYLGQNGGSDLAMSTITGPSGSYVSTGWHVQDNVWNPSGLTYPQDYTIAADYDPNNPQTGTRFYWTFPARTSTNYYNVHAYPELLFGASPWWGTSGGDATDPLHTFPVALSSLTGLVANYNLTAGGDTQGYNVAFEMWLTNQPDGGSSSITNEVMVWFHVGAFSPGGSVLTTYSDADYSGTIYNAYNWNAGTDSQSWTYTAFAPSSDDLSGQIDLYAMLQKLKSLGIITGNEYLATLELGAEVATGQGSLTVNSLEYDLQKNDGTNTIIGGKTGTSGNDIISGGAGGDTLTGNAGNDQLFGNDGDDSLLGGDGNDTLTGGAGNDTLDGGAGTDCAIYSGNRSAYTITSNGSGTTTISGPDGTDSLTNVESAVFADQTVTLITSSDDYAGSTATTGVVAIGGSTTGSIEITGDTDWFKVTLVAGHTYQFDVEGHASGNGTLVDPCMWLRDSSSSVIAYDDDISSSDWDSRITYTATASGTFFIEAASRSTPGTYRVAATEIASADDYAASTATTGVVAIGGSTTGSIETAGDHDWFKVTLTAGHTYQFDVEGHASGNGTLVDPCMWLRDSSGNVIAYDDDISSSDWDSRITYTATTSGTFFIDAASRSTPGTYRVAAADVGSSDDYAGSTATTGVVAIGGSTTGNIETAGDTDWFKVTLTAGNTYQFDVEGHASGNGTLVDPCMWLLDGSGNVIAYNDDISTTDWDSRITSTATTSGTYFIEAASRSTPGTYRVAATEITSADDYAASTATTGVVAIGGSTTGSIETAGDHDWFKVTLTAGHTYQFDVEGHASGNGTLVDPCMWLRDSSGSVIAYDDDISSSDWDSRITYTATTSGTYFIDAASRSTPGTYRVAATEITASDDYAASTATTGVVTIGGSTTGNIETVGDHDWFKVTLTAGQAYQFDLEGHASGNGTLVDPCMWLRDGSGNVITYNDDISTSDWDSRIVYTPTVSGTYFLDAASRGGPGTYTLFAAVAGGGP